MKATSFLACFSVALYCTSAAQAQSLEWTRQLGTSSWDRSHGVSADGLGSVYISGYTLGGLEGTNAGLSDAFVAKFIDPIVPEPSTLLLFCIGALGVVALRKRRGTR